MNSLEFIEKEIDVTKKQLAKYPLSKEQSDPNYKYKEADIQYIHNKYYTERLQTLQQIKTELEAWEVVKKYVKEISVNGIAFEHIINVSHTKQNYEVIKKALEVEDDK